MATEKELNAAIGKLKEPQKSVAKAIYNQAKSTGKRVSSGEATYILNNLGSITASTDPKAFLGTAAQRAVANKSKTAITAAAPKQTATDFASQYGSRVALVNGNPELQAIFNQAVTEKWSPDKFSAVFESSKWFQSNGPTWREAETARASDPGAWNAALTKVKNQINQSARDMGFELNPADVDKLAEDTLHLSWGEGVDEALLKQNVATVGRITGTGGEAATTMQKLKEEAASMGVQYGDDWFANAAKSTLAGQSNMDYYNQKIRDDAKSKYAAFADQIDKGQTVAAIASPYIQSMARILELSPTDIDLNDSTIQKALVGFDAQNKPVAKPTWEFERELKQDDRYFKTNTAVRDMTGLASEIARQFGKM
jgi:hypothetical protein